MNQTADSAKKWEAEIVVTAANCGKAGAVGERALRRLRAITQQAGYSVNLGGNIVGPGEAGRVASNWPAFASRVLEDPHWPARLLDEIAEHGGTFPPPGVIAEPVPSNGPKRPTAGQMRFLVALVRHGGVSWYAVEAAGRPQSIRACLRQQWVREEFRPDGGVRHVLLDAGRDLVQKLKPAWYQQALPAAAGVPTIAQFLPQGTLQLWGVPALLVGSPTEPRWQWTSQTCPSLPAADDLLTQMGWKRTSTWSELAAGPQEAHVVRASPHVSDGQGDPAGRPFGTLASAALRKHLAGQVHPDSGDTIPESDRDEGLTWPQHTSPPTTVPPVSLAADVYGVDERPLRAGTATDPAPCEQPAGEDHAEHVRNRTAAADQAPHGQTGNEPAAPDRTLTFDVATFNHTAGGLVADGTYRLDNLRRAFSAVDTPPAMIFYCEMKRGRQDGKRGLYATAAALSAEFGRPYVGLLGACEGTIHPAIFYDATAIQISQWWGDGALYADPDYMNTGVFHALHDGIPVFTFRAWVDHWHPTIKTRRYEQAKRLGRWGRDEAMPTIGGGDLNETASGSHLPRRDWAASDYRTSRSTKGRLDHHGTWGPHTDAIDHLLGRYDEDTGQRADGCGFVSLAEITWQHTGAPIQPTTHQEYGGLLIDWLLANPAMARYVDPAGYRTYPPQAAEEPVLDHDLVVGRLAVSTSKEDGRSIAGSRR